MGISLACGSGAASKSNAAPGGATAVAAAAGGSGLDTVRGTVLVVRSDRFNQVALRTKSDTVTLTGDVVPEIARAGGADVWVEGTRESPAEMHVSQFLVRAVNGRPALDGVLVAEGDQLFVLSADGSRHMISHAPGALRQHLGDRVWIASAPNSIRAVYGVLQRAR